MTTVIGLRPCHHDLDAAFPRVQRRAIGTERYYCIIEPHADLAAHAGSIHAFTINRRPPVFEVTDQVRGRSRPDEALRQPAFQGRPS